MTGIKERLDLMCRVFAMDPRNKACIQEAADYIEKLEDLLLDYADPCEMPKEDAELMSEIYQRMNGAYAKDRGIE